MKIVFFGTPNYVLPILDSLHRKLKVKGESPIVAVVTQAPKPTGRKKEFQFSAVDTWAHKRGVQKYYDPNDLINNKVDADMGVLASFGKIIPVDVIKIFRYGILNVHPSMLPLWRGASPVQATIISDSQAGASIIKLDEKLDSGPIVSQFKDEVLPDDTTETLRNRLFERSADVLTTLIPAYLAGKITPRNQDDSKATYTRQIKKSDAFIPPKYLAATLQGATFKGQALQEQWKIDFMNDFTIHPSPPTIHNFIRAMQPWPIAWTEIKIMVNSQWSKRRLKILEAHTEKLVPSASCLVPDLVQLEGKNPVSWKQFKEGYKFKFSSA